MECIVCGTPISKRARTCSDKCKQIAYRNRKQGATVTSVTPATVTKPTVTDLELCRYCRKPLPKLGRPRRYTGACYECALANADRPKSADDLWPPYRYEPMELIRL